MPVDDDEVLEEQEEFCCCFCLASSKPFVLTIPTELVDLDVEIPLSDLCCSATSIDR